MTAGDDRAEDATLGGYFRLHERPPAFAGSDGEAYSVAVYLDDAPGPDGLFGGSLLFVRWSPGGEQPAGHVESGCLARRESAAEADAAVRALTLHEVKDELDRALARARELGEW
jgi:hypothetical protein